MTRPKAILFDLGNVLFEIDIPQCSKNIYALLDDKVDPREFREEFRIKNEGLETGSVSKAVFVNFLLSRSKKGTQALDVILAWNSMLIGLPSHHLTMLKDLRKKFRVYLLSNINAFHLPRFKEMIAEDLGEQDFDSYFNQCFYSHLIGYRKPDPKAFQFVIDQISLPPEEILYLDDTEGHLATAREFNIQTKLIQNIGQTGDVARSLVYGQ